MHLLGGFRASDGDLACRRTRSQHFRARASVGVSLEGLILEGLKELRRDLPLEDKLYATLGSSI